MFRDRPTLGFKVCVWGLRLWFLGGQASFFFGVVARSFARSLSLSLPPSLGGEREGGDGDRQVCAGDAWAILGFKVCV